MDGICVSQEQLVGKHPLEGTKWSIMQLLIDESDFPFFIPLDEWNILKKLASMPVQNLPKEISAIPKYVLDSQANNTSIQPTMSVLEGGDEKDDSKGSEGEEGDEDVEMSEKSGNIPRKAEKRGLEDDDLVPPPSKKRKMNPSNKTEVVEGGGEEEKGEGSEKSKEKEEGDEIEENRENDATPPLTDNTQLTPVADRAPKRTLVDISSSQSGDDEDSIAKGPPAKKSKLLSGNASASTIPLPSQSKPEKDQPEEELETEEVEKEQNAHIVPDTYAENEMEEEEVSEDVHLSQNKGRDPDYVANTYPVDEEGQEMEMEEEEEEDQMQSSGSNVPSTIPYELADNSGYSGYPRQLPLGPSLGFDLGDEGVSYDENENPTEVREDAVFGYDAEDEGDGHFYGEDFEEEFQGDGDELVSYDDGVDAAFPGEDAVDELNEEYGGEEA